MIKRNSDFFSFCWLLLLLLLYVSVRKCMTAVKVWHGRNCILSARLLKVKSKRNVHVYVELISAEAVNLILLFTFDLSPYTTLSRSEV